MHAHDTCAHATHVHIHTCAHTGAQGRRGKDHARHEAPAQHGGPARALVPLCRRAPLPQQQKRVPRPQMSARQSPARLPAGRASRERCERGPRRLPSRRNEDSSKPGNRGTSGGVPSLLCPPRDNGVCPLTRTSLGRVNPENCSLTSLGSRAQRHSKLCLSSPYLPAGAILAWWPEAPARTPATGSSPSPGSSQPLAATSQRAATPAFPLHDASIRRALRRLAG